MTDSHAPGAHSALLYDAPGAPAGAAPWRPWQRAAAVVGPPVLVAVLAASVLLSVRRYQTAREAVRHTEAVRTAALLTLSHTQDAETGQRGFLLTGDSAYLIPHQTATRAIAVDLGRLRTLTRDNAAQARRLDTLGTLVRAKLAELDETIHLRATGRGDEALRVVRTDRGRRVMDEIRAELGHVVAAEDALLAERERAETRAGRITLAVVVIGAVLTALLTMLVNRLLASVAKRHARQAEHLSVANDQLRQQQVELELVNEQLHEQAAELEAQQAELELQTAEAEGASRAKSDFLSTMSHELRTPLNAIGGYAQLLEMEVHGPVSEPQREALGRITRAQQHLLSLINDILNLSRIEAGKIEYDVRAMALGDVVADVVPMVEPQLAAKAIVLTVDPSVAAAPAVSADADRLRQVLLNLLSNAAKFTPPNGRVDVAAVEVAGRAGCLGLRVRDTGYGIPADKLAVVFEPFVQLHRQPPRDAVRRVVPSLQGTGLGLSISRDLLRGMGGDLEVESVEGAGSAFTAVLRRALYTPGH